MGTIYLSDVAAGIGGFKIIGEDQYDQAGFSVAAAGDFNGDGFDDIIVGARYGGTDGTAYVLFGKAGGFGTVDLATVAAGSANGFEIVGEKYSHVIISVATAGDVNGDGLDDVIVGAPQDGDASTGAAYVLLGKAMSFGTVELATIAAGSTAGFKIVGENQNDLAGFSVDAAGDFNGDGFDDVIVGAHQNEGVVPPYERAGAAYVLFGNGTASGTIDLDMIAAGSADGFKIIGKSQSLAGISVAAAGDINGDGFGDVVVGAMYGGNSSPGTAYVLFGKSSGLGTVDLATIAASPADGFKIVGETSLDLAGFFVASAGDVNGDGFDDLMVGASRNDAGGTDAGAAYVILGTDKGFDTINLATIAAGLGGFKIIGENAGDLTGRPISSAGDVNGDGFDDLLVGAYYNDAGGTNTGAAYVLFGKDSGFGTVNLDDIAVGSTAGFKIIGENGDVGVGFSVASAGDVNGDGFDEIIVGAPFNTAGGNGAGAAYVIFGKETGFGADPVGTDGDDLLVGNASNNTLEGLAGNDTLTGLEGADSLDGGDGIDTATYQGSASGVAVNLASGTGSGGDAQGDTLINIENLDGSAGDDLLIGNSNANTLIGGTGKDSLGGDVGDDFIDGGEGDDALIGNHPAGPSDNDGQDTLLGGAGNDSLGGEGGDDLLDGGDGNDSLDGGSGDDSLDGGTGRDALHGGAGNDTLDGGDGRDSLYGEAGDDYLQGGNNADLLDGGSGHDTLRGSYKDDVLYGGNGADLLIGAEGDDIIDGGAGKDTIVYNATALGTADVTAGTHDTLLTAVGDKLRFSADLDGELTIAGTSLAAATKNIVLDGDFDAGTNIRFNGTAIEIDLNGDQAFVAQDDFQIDLSAAGVGSVTFVAANDWFVFA